MKKKLQCIKIQNLGKIFKNKSMKIKIIIIFFLLSHVVFSQLDYKKFIGEKSKITFDKEYSYTNIYDYKINASKEDSIIIRKLRSSIPEGLLTDLYVKNLSNNKKDSISFEIIMSSRLLIDIKNERICFIKYKTRLNNTVSKDLIFKATEIAENWKELTDSSVEVKLLEQIVLSTNVNTLFLFYDTNDNPEYSEINKLKPLVKDVNGALNIEKLAEVIQQNKIVLSKYLE